MRRLVYILASVVMMFVSCTDLSDVEKRLDRIEGEISDINSAIEALNLSYSNGKVITDVQPSQQSVGGWIITFSDGTFIELLNGADGADCADGKDGADCADAQRAVIPFLMVEGDGYWCVSYDNGATFSRIMDNNAAYIKSTDSDTEEGVQIRIDRNDEGYYVYLLYRKSQPSKIIDVVVTPYKADNKGIVASIIHDKVRNTLSLTLSDGSTFVFNKEDSTPASIALLTTGDLLLSKGGTVSFEFRVNPSTAIFNYDVNSEDCEIELDMVGSSRSSYVTKPVNYKLSKVEQVYSAEGVMKVGQYRAYITDVEKSNDYSEQVALVLSVTNKNNETLQISSSAMNIKVKGNLITSFSFLAKNNSNVTHDIVVPVTSNEIVIYSSYITDLKRLRATFVTNGERVYVGNKEQINGVTENDFTSPVVYTVVSADGEVNEYRVSVYSTKLAVMFIDTPNGASIPLKTQDWLGETKIKIYRTDGTVDFECTDANIRIRGNSTSNYPKKPYALKLEKKASLLGMSKHKRWALLANWMDRTLIRNSTAFFLAKQTGLAWTPSGEFVEVMLNGKHIGNYFLCEQIKIDENRVNINEMAPTDVEGDAITGGYLLELDVNYDEVNKFKSEKKNLPYMIKEPDEDDLNQAQFDYIVDYVNRFERMLYLDAAFQAGKFREYIDEDSFIDQWFVFELTQNSEIGHPKSCYMYKDKGGKMFAGPVWDFDWGTFMPGVTGYKARDAMYYGRLFADKQFCERVKERWAELKPKLKHVLAHIDEEAELLAESDEKNIALWPISSRVNGDETMSYTQAVARLRSAFEERIKWLNTRINAM